MMRLATIMFMASCSSVQPGVADASDADCGNNLFLRRGAGIDCDYARAAVYRSGGPRPGWRIIITGGFPGLAVDRDMRAYVPAGVTYPLTKTVEVASGRLDVLPHELGHVDDIEAGRPNLRDRGVP